MSLIDHIRKCLAELEPHDSKLSWLVAVSGGLDSMVLLHALQSLQMTIQVAHVNYHLRGEDSDLDATLVQNYCKANQIDFHLLDANMESKKGVQAEARRQRYEWFSKLIGQHNLAGVITAHHQSDQAETLLFNLSRGSGVSGASAMDTHSNGVFRPILKVPKQQINDYARDHQVPYRNDESNSSNKYARNKIRNEVIPLLESVNKGVVEHLASFTDIMKEVNSLLVDQVRVVWESNIIILERGLELGLSKWIETKSSRLVLSSILQKLHIDQKYTNDVFEVVFSQSGKRIITGNYEIWKDRNSLIFIDRNSYKNSTEELVIPEEGNYEINGVHFSVRKEPLSHHFNEAKNSFIMDWNRVAWPLKIRTIRDGDSFQPFGMKGRKKISDFLIQEKVPVVLKKSVLVLENNNEIMWVIKMRSSEKTRLTDKTINCLKIDISV